MSSDATTDFTRRLRDDCLDDWGAGVRHRFVEELLSGDLDDEVLTRHLVQDYQFFDLFLRLLGEAVATAPTGPARLRLGRQIGMLTTVENGYFEDTFNTLCVGMSARLHPPLTCETVDLIDLTYETIGTHSWPHVLSVLVAVEWLRLEWSDADGRGIVSERPEHRTWIDLHRGDEFGEWVTFLRQQLDAAEPDDLDEADRCHDFFRRAVQAELAFFDAAYRPDQPCEESPLNSAVPDDLAARLHEAFRERLSD
jgi:thiaminase/transcriptional activator TenA